MSDHHINALIIGCCWWLLFGSLGWALCIGLLFYLLNDSPNAPA